MFIDIKHYNSDFESTSIPINRINEIADHRYGLTKVHYVHYTGDVFYVLTNSSVREITARINKLCRGEKV